MIPAKFNSMTLVMFLLVICESISVQSVNGVEDSKTVPEKTDSGLNSSVVWYGNLKDGLTVAQETGRPIMLLSAAPQCAGVPGMW